MRLKWLDSNDDVIDVSIHAPARGATKHSVLSKNIVYGFNSRTRAGCDAKSADGATFTGWFQFTHPRGVRRQKPRHRIRVIMSFNSRTRAGCDTIRHRTYCDVYRFQFTHPRGVRHKMTYACNRCIGVSIHAPARGATIVIFIQFIIYDGFNSRTRAGCDLSSKTTKLVSQTVSIHAPARGATHTPFFRCRVSPVSIHAPARGATPDDTNHDTT